MERSNADIVRTWVRRLLPWVLLAFGAWLLFHEISRRSPVAVGATAPALEASLADGTHFDLVEQRGQVVVLNFWATWCPPCRAEAPALTRAHRRLEAQGGTVLGLTMDGGDLGTVARAARGLGMEYPVGRADPQATRRYRVSQLPTTFVVGPDGRIARTFVGMVSEEELVEAIDGAASGGG